MKCKRLAQKCQKAGHTNRRLSKTWRNRRLSWSLIVGIVMEVGENDMVIKDMNYRALNEVTTRRENFDNPAIIGYIYVD